MTELLEQIKKLGHAMAGQPRWKRVLDEMYAHMRLPMADVLAKVPGEYNVDKMAALGITKTTYYEWMRESFRPNEAQAEKLAKITGYPAEAIHGQTEEKNDARRAAKKAPAAVARSSKAASRMHGRARRALRGSKRAKRVAQPQT